MRPVTRRSLRSLENERPGDIPRGAVLLIAVVADRSVSTSHPCRRPPPGIGGDFSSSFFSTTTHSVVSSRLATEAAFCNAVRVTLVGIDHARGDQIFELAGLGVVAE